MSTKDQYEFFRGLYEEEERTTQQLESRANIYLGVISAFVAAVVFGAHDLKTGVEFLQMGWWGLLLATSLFAAALLVVIYALRIRRFEAVCDAEKIITEYGEEIPTDEEFFDDRIADYAVAADRNREINNDIAKCLQYAGYILISGIVILLILIIISLGRNA